jgi:ABC-type phosphate transport system auxiliary subunit
MNIEFYPQSGYIKDMIGRSEWVLINEKGDRITLKFEKGRISSLISDKILFEYISTKSTILERIEKLKGRLDYLKNEIEEDKML